MEYGEKGKFSPHGENGKSRNFHQEFVGETFHTPTPGQLILSLFLAPYFQFLFP
jgi:hypothetical protein